MKGLTLAFLLTFCLFGYTQDEDYDLLSFYLGSSMGSGFLNKSLTNPILQFSRRQPGTFNLNSEILYNERFGIELSLGQQWNRFKIQEKITASDNRNYTVDNTLKNDFMRSGINFSMYNQVFLFSRSVTLMTKLGIEHQNIKETSVTDSEYFNIDNEDMSLNVTYPQSRLFIRPEIGVMFGELSRYLNDYSWFLSISYNQRIQGGSTLATYSVNDALNGTLKRETNFESNGNALNFNIGIRKKIGDISWKKKEKEKKEKKPKKEKRPKKEKEVAQAPDPDKEKSNKDIELSRKITVQKNPVTISIWDNGKIDGDSVSLFLNKTPILEDFLLKEEKHHLQVMLEPGENLIVMKALNLGSIPPNTATLILDDGVTKREITLKSSLQKSGAIRINYEPADPEE